MKIKSFKYNFVESFKNIYRNGIMSVASMSSVAAALIILGLVYVLIVNLNSITMGAQEQYDSIQVYIVDGLSDQEVTAIGESIKKLDSVKSVRYETKDEALKKMQASWQENAYLLDGLEDNPLPNAFEVRFSKLSVVPTIAEQIKAMNGVEDVKYYRDIIEKMTNITKMIRNLGLVIIFALLFLSTFIINNTIKLAVNARRREINIMKYVGATNWFVRWPFFIEGTVLGLLGAMVALVIVGFLYQYVYGIMTQQFYALIAAYIVSPRIIFFDLFLIFVIIGMGIGALGSLMSMRKYLNV